MATSTLGSGTLVLAGTTSGSTTVTATAVAGTTTLTLPAATDTLVGKATTDTLTNKTLTTPSVSSPTISDGTANGVAYLNGSKVLTTGSALTFSGTVLSAVGGGYTDAIGGGNIQSSDGTRTLGLTANFTASTPGIYSSGANPIAFYINSTEGMRLTSTSLYTASTINVGIGTSSPARKLSVSSGSTSAAYIQLCNTTSGTGVGQGFEVFSDGTNAGLINRQNGYLEFDTNNIERARITSGGYFKASNAGTYNGATGLYHEFRGDSANSYVAMTVCTNSTPLSEYIQDFRFSAATPNDGNARFWSCTDATAERAYMRSNGGLSNYQGNDTSLSDRREKTNFSPAKSYLDVICAIPIQTFNYIDQNMEEDGGLTLGVVAQDVQAVAPELVTEGNWGSKEEPKMRLEIYQTDLQYALMKCIQEQQTIITQLTARITALEGA
jgi:hypothetical protein